MKVSELIEELKNVDQDLPVRVWADHGQHSMLASSAVVRYVDKENEDEWMLEESFAEENLGDEEYTELTKKQASQFFEIGAP